MTDLLLIAGAACCALVFIHVMRAPVHLKKWLWGERWYEHRLKPLDCEACLAFWLGIIFSIFFHKNPLFVPCIGATSSILAVLITKHMNR